MQKIILGLALLLISAGFQAHAQKMYRWVDAQGNAHYGDRPPVGAKEIRVRSNSADAQETAPTATAEQIAECESLKQRLASYEAATELIQEMADGTRRSFSEAETEQVIERTKASVSAACENT